MQERDITYHWGDRTLLITLGNKVTTLMRMAYVAEFIFTAGMATVFFLLAFPFIQSVLNWTAVFGSLGLYLIALYRLFSRLHFSEQVLLDTHHVTIIRKTLLSRKAIRYDWQHIGTLHFEGIHKRIYRSFKKRYMDYLRFRGHDYKTKDLHNEGNMYFDAIGGRIYFAPGVSSVDADRLVQIMKLYTGPSLKLGPEWEEMLQEQEYGDTSPN